MFGVVPFTIKDTGPYAKGKPFCLGSSFLEGFVAPVDTQMMERFRADGLAIIGITTAPELTISFSTGSKSSWPTCNLKILRWVLAGQAAALRRWCPPAHSSLRMPMTVSVRSACRRPAVA